MNPKFRAWDKDLKCWCPYRIYSLEKLGDDIVEFMYIPQSIWYKNKELDDNFVLMQSTGFKDVNGVEIFEGDILSRKTHVWMYGSDLNEWVTESYPVVWQDGGWYLNEEPLAFILEEGVYKDGFRRTALEVIGNIYENPELMEAE